MAPILEDAGNCAPRIEYCLSSDIDTATDLSLQTDMPFGSLVHPEDDVKILFPDYNDDLNWIQDPIPFSSVLDDSKESRVREVTAPPNEYAVDHSCPMNSFEPAMPYIWNYDHLVNSIYTNPVQESTQVGSSGSEVGRIVTDGRSNSQGVSRPLFPLYHCHLVDNIFQDHAAPAVIETANTSQPVSILSFRGSGAAAIADQVKLTSHLFPHEGTSLAAQDPFQPDLFQNNSTIDQTLAGVGGAAPYVPLTDPRTTLDPYSMMFDSTFTMSDQKYLSHDGVSLQDDVPISHVPTHVRGGYLPDIRKLEQSPRHFDESSVSVTGVNRDKSKDDFLLRCKAAGMSYKEIKAKGEFDEAESTLRGRYRSLTKPRNARVRKPEWTRRDVSCRFREDLLTSALLNKQLADLAQIEMLKQTVARYLQASAVRSSADHFHSQHGGARAQLHALNKVPWKLVAETMSNRGCYRFGNATVKKKYLEVMKVNGGATSL